MIGLSGLQFLICGKMIVISWTVVTLLKEICRLIRNMQIVGVDW